MLSIWPANWKIASGNAVKITSRDGYSMPVLRAGTFLFSEGNSLERYVRNRHHVDTKPNCTVVSVTGCGRAFKIDFDEVFVVADVVYHTMQRTCRLVNFLHRKFNREASEIGSSYYQSTGKRRSKNLSQFIRVGAYTGVACADRAKRFADTFP